MDRRWNKKESIKTVQRSLRWKQWQQINLVNLALNLKTVSTLLLHHNIWWGKKPFRLFKRSKRIWGSFVSDLCKWERRKYHSELSICWVLNLREAPSPVVKSSMNGLYYILLSSVKMSCRTFVVTGAVPMQLPSGEWMRCQVKHSKFCYLAMSCLCWEKEHDPCSWLPVLPSC